MVGCGLRLLLLRRRRRQADGGAAAKVVCGAGLAAGHARSRWHGQCARPRDGKWSAAGGRAQARAARPRVCPELAAAPARRGAATCRRGAWPPEERSEVARGARKPGTVRWRRRKGSRAARAAPTTETAVPLESCYVLLLLLLRVADKGRAASDFPESIVESKSISGVRPSPALTPPLAQARLAGRSLCRQLDVLSGQVVEHELRELVKVGELQVRRSR